MLDAGAAQAQLGWTDDDCQNKWGLPTSTHMNLEAGTLECTFSTGSDLRVQVDFQNDKVDSINRVQSIIYSSASKKFLSANIRKLLQANYACNWQLYNDGRGKATTHTWQVWIRTATMPRTRSLNDQTTVTDGDTHQVATGYFDSYFNAHGGEPQ